MRALSSSLSALVPSRFSVYAAASAALAWAVVAHAFATREQFYPAVIFLVTSKLSIVCLSNLAFVLVVALAKVLKLLFLGDLRPNEVERVNEQLRYTIPEVVISLTIFREELNSRVVSLFAMLLFSKFFHIVVSERMTWLDSPGDGERASRLQHVRLVALMWALFLMNAQCLAVFGHMLHEQGHSVLILFAFEYCVMELEVVKVMYRYAIHLIARRQARLNERAEWPNRSLYLMYGKLAVDTVKLGVYVLYFLLLLHFYSMPIPMVRDLVRSFMDVKRELENVVESRRLLTLIHLLPSPTDEELARLDPTCAVCQDDVTPVTKGAAKILLCNHIFHEACLLSWWQRKRTCPTCSFDINVMLRGAAARQRNAPAGAAAAAAAGAGPGAEAVAAGAQMHAAGQAARMGPAAAAAAAAIALRAMRQQAELAGGAEAERGGPELAGEAARPLAGRVLRRRRGLGTPSAAATPSPATLPPPLALSPRHTAAPSTPMAAAAAAATAMAAPLSPLVPLSLEQVQQLHQHLQMQQQLGAAGLWGGSPQWADPLSAQLAALAQAQQQQQQQLLLSQLLAQQQALMAQLQAQAQVQAQLQPQTPRANDSEGER